MARLLIVIVLFACILIVVIEGMDRVDSTRPPRDIPPAATSTSAILSPGYPRRPLGLEQVTVIGVVDGDTVVVWWQGREERVRLIGLNTPETMDPRRPVQCFGFQASVATTEMLEGQRVWMEADPSQSDRDRYDRLLRYLWLEDGRIANLELIRLGFGSEYTYDTPYAYRDPFLEAESEARQAGRGLWSATTCDGDFDRPIVPTPTIPPDNCDPAYPEICVPPPPPDLDCSDIPYRNFRVLPPDPHQFDGGQDGIGCEG